MGHRGQFKKGESGNPKGRPKGATNHRTRFIQALKSQGKTEQDFILKVIEHAEQGNATALGIAADRLLKPTKTIMPPIRLPDAESKQEHASNAIAAVAAGEISPDQGDAFLRALRASAELDELQDIRDRLDALEDQ